ncbi:hypothetical protein [Pedosphaera parvula]|uniref:hypothetical protein n=1 Tax=Pedosphaera parvula TaxID=1032527 RepID=UPI00135F152E|nr:hypothetical protein [Pedosphaera parvula]
MLGISSLVWSECHEQFDGKPIANRRYGRLKARATGLWDVVESWGAYADWLNWLGGIADDVSVRGTLRPPIH